MADPKDNGDPERGKRIAALRRQRLDISQGALAKRLDIDKTTVHRWERGATPHGESLQRLAQALGCSAEYIMSGREPPQSRNGHSEAPPELVELQRRIEAGAFPLATHVEPWMLELLRDMRIPADRSLTFEFYHNALVSMITHQGPKRHP